MNKSNFLILLVSLLIPLITFSSANPKDSLKFTNWQNLDPELDKIMGVSVERAYDELLEDKKPTPVVVAVIDGGIDIEHEDIKDIIWKNEDEIPGNGIDDDNNGYIDDINGWNFIGNSNGKNINNATLEVTRLYRLYNKKYPDISIDSIQKLDKEDFINYAYVWSTYELKLKEAELSYEAVMTFKETYHKSDSLIKAELGKERYEKKDLKKLKTEKKSLADSAKKFMLSVIKKEIGMNRVLELEEVYSNRVNYHYNTDFFSREIMGDDEYEWSEHYGNPDVIGEDPTHGTMVSGIIGGVRNNGIGVNGIADNVKIMAIRTVPNGDEWDKDVANAIKYAIDNGAEIINMSFGKGFSPQKHFVDSVVKLADENNVLLIHAAGNDNNNIDIIDNFPNQYGENSEILANNYLTIGASAISTKKKQLVADFSNYGKQNVDVFAPGHDMLLCAPGDRYEIASGTSFAAPVVTGVATLIKSYYPSLTAAELKEIILESSIKDDYKVILPGTSGKTKTVVKFSSLSVTGGIVNVYRALKLAEEKSK